MVQINKANYKANSHLVLSFQNEGTVLLEEVLISASLNANHFYSYLKKFKLKAKTKRESKPTGSKPTQVCGMYVCNTQI